MKKIIKTVLIFLIIVSTTACSNTTVTEIGTDAQSGTVLDASVNVQDTESVQMAADTETTDIVAENEDTHEDQQDYDWEGEAVVEVSLNGDTISVNGEGVKVNGSTATITSAGNYRFSGTLNDGQILVDTEDEDVVRLILNGVNLYSSTNAPVFIKSADKAVIILTDNTENIITDGNAYVFEADEDEPNAAVFSKADLTIYGGGTLTVSANYNDGISSKDGLILSGGVINVQSVDDGIRGKDYIVVEGAVVTVLAAGDGLKSDEDEDTGKGFITIEDGTININSGGDAITAQTNVTIMNGTFTLVTSGETEMPEDGTISAKAVKGLVSVVIENGVFTIDAYDDAIHSNQNIVINGGTFTIASGDDGMHADSTLEINGGTFTITKSYEGLESAVITINDGVFDITASDDGINVAGGTDGSGMNPMQQPGVRPEQQPGMPPGGQTPGENPGGREADGGVETGSTDNSDAESETVTASQPGGPPQDMFAGTGDYYLYINGGYILVNSGGDGLDANGSIEMTGGTVIVNGPITDREAALDYNVEFTITGGFLVAVGSSGMAQAPGEASTQNSLLVNFTANQFAGTMIHIQNDKGENLLTFVPEKQFQSVAFSSPELATGENITVFLGGSSSGAVVDGLYTEGSYTPGVEYESLSITGTVTLVGSQGRR